MPAVEIETKDGTTVYISFASGAGTSGDPYVMTADRATETTLDAIKTAVELLDNMISGSEGQVDIVTLPGTSEADITAIKTAVEILDNAIAGSEIQADIVGALPTGTNSIGSLKDNGPAEAGTDTYTASADMSTAANIGPAPSGGEKSVLLQATISTDTAMKFTLQMETTAGAERREFYLPANGSIVFVPRYPIKLDTVDKRWQGKASVAGNVSISTTTKSEA